jgi:hypothetical protein
MIAPRKAPIAHSGPENPDSATFLPAPSLPARRRHACPGILQARNGPSRDVRPTNKTLVLGILALCNGPIFISPFSR